jgi:hypothetical protein
VGYPRPVYPPPRRQKSPLMPPAPTTDPYDRSNAAPCRCAADSSDKECIHPFQTSASRNQSGVTRASDIGLSRLAGGRSRRPQEAAGVLVAAGHSVRGGRGPGLAEPIRPGQQARHGLQTRPKGCARYTSQKLPPGLRTTQKSLILNGKSNNLSGLARFRES